VFKGEKEAGLFIPFTVLTIDSGGSFDACVVFPPLFSAHTDTFLFASQKDASCRAVSTSSLSPIEARPDGWSRYLIPLSKFDTRDQTTEGEL